MSRYGPAATKNPASKPSLTHAVGRDAKLTCWLNGVGPLAVGGMPAVKLSVTNSLPLITSTTLLPCEYTPSMTPWCQLAACGQPAMSVSALAT